MRSTLPGDVWHCSSEETWLILPSNWKRHGCFSWYQEESVKAKKPAAWRDALGASRRQTRVPWTRLNPVQTRGSQNRRKRLEKADGNGWIRDINNHQHQTMLRWTDLLAENKNQRQALNRAYFTRKVLVVPRTCLRPPICAHVLFSRAVSWRWADVAWIATCGNFAAACFRQIRVANLRQPYTHEVFLYGAADISQPFNWTWTTT